MNKSFKNRLSYTGIMARPPSLQQVLQAQVRAVQNAGFSPLRGNITSAEQFQGRPVDQPGAPNLGRGGKFTPPAITQAIKEDISNLSEDIPHEKTLRHNRQDIKDPQSSLASPSSIPPSRSVTAFGGILPLVIVGGVLAWIALQN